MPAQPTSVDPLLLLPAVSPTEDFKPWLQRRLLLLTQDAQHIQRAVADLAGLDKSGGARRAG